jgi:hypothetical protein
MHTMHLLPSVAIQPNLELKTRPKQPLGSLPLVIALPSHTLSCSLALSFFTHQTYVAQQNHETLFRA